MGEPGKSFYIRCFDVDLGFRAKVVYVVNGAELLGIIIYSVV